MRLMTGRYTKNMVLSTERVLSLSKQQAGRAGGSAYSLCAAFPEKTTWRYTLYRQRQQTGCCCCCCPLNDKLTLVCKNDVSLYKTISTIRLCTLLRLGVRKVGRAR